MGSFAPVLAEETVGNKLEPWNTISKSILNRMRELADAVDVREIGKDLDLILVVIQAEPPRPRERIHEALGCLLIPHGSQLRSYSLRRITTLQDASLLVKPGVLNTCGSVELCRSMSEDF